MPWNDLIWSWLVHSAIASLVVLALGSGAALLCRQPARRIRIIELALAGCLAAPWLGVIPGYPQLAIGWWHAKPHERPAVTQSPLARHTPNPSRPRGDAPPLWSSGERGAPMREALQSVFDAPTVRWWISALYLLGVAAGAAWWLAGIVGLAWLVLTARPAPPRCRDLLGDIAGPPAGRVRLLLSGRLQQPFAAAWGRPVVVLPESLRGDERAMRFSLAHEWAHVERRDFRRWLMSGIARVLFFYQPLVWWLRRELRLAQDFLADSQAARQARQPEDYAEFLTGRAAAGGLQPAIAGLGMGARKSELYRRVVALVRNQPMEARAPQLWNLSVTFTALGLVAVLAAILRGPEAQAGKVLTASSPMPAAGRDLDPNPVDLLKSVQRAREAMSPARLLLELRYKSWRVETNQRISVWLANDRRRFEVVSQDLVRTRSIFDGDKILSYDGVGSATILDPSSPNSEYLFDPRTLGLTVVYRPSESVGSCLGYQDAVEVKLLGREDVQKTECWHVRVIDSFKQQLDFWIEDSDAVRVHRCEFRFGQALKVTTSEYDEADTRKVLPKKVETRSYFAKELSGERWIIVKDHSTPSKIDPAMWTLAGLNLPIGTPVSDIRIRRRLGYWDGEKLIANPPARPSS